MYDDKQKSLRSRLQKISTALEQLKIPRRGKKKLISIDDWESAVTAILKRYRTTGLFQIDYQTEFRSQESENRHEFCTSGG